MSLSLSLNGRTRARDVVRLRPRAEPKADTPPFLRSPGRFIAHYVRGRPWLFGGLILVVFLAAGCAVGVQYVMKLLVDAMSGVGWGQAYKGHGAAWIALGGFLGLIAIESVMWRISGILGCRATVRVGVDVRLDLFDYLSTQSMRFFADNMAGSLGQRITATSGNFGALIHTVVWRISPPTIDFFGALIVFTTVDWRMALALAVFVSLVTTGLILFGQRGRPLHRNFADRAGTAAGEMVDVISNMWAVKAFSARGREGNRLATLFRREANAQVASWMYTEKTRVIHDVALCLMAGTMLVWAVYSWSVGRITPGDVVVVSALTFRILHGSRDLALAMVDGVQQFGFIEETLRVVGQPRSVVDAPNARPLQVEGGAIELRSVGFSYGRKGVALHDMTLTIPAGQKLGVVGPSGAGKSTLIQLLQRLHDPQSGEIRIDGQPITEVTQDSLRAAIAVVPQDTTLFHRTILENIRFGRPNATDEEVYAAAKAAFCDDFIRALPDGYLTRVGERGVKLSGGQRQRIGIARAFLKNAPILILDEATSALDTESEMEIQRALTKLMHGRTVIALAHRLSTLSAFDRIIVLNKGHIVEDGSIGELRRRGGLFDRMWKLQSEGMILEDLAA